MFKVNLEIGYVFLNKPVPTHGIIASSLIGALVKLI
ncbi:hypothetical protein SRABI84_04314 [Peribacillus simplex]|nr:hypothetical protein SRABI84_04314 [Peribacillus simplex]